MVFGKVLIQNTLSRLLNTVLIFLITIFLTRQIGASDFGVLTLMIANASILNLILSLGFSSGITYNLAAKSLNDNKIHSVTILLLLAQLFFTSIIEFGFLILNDSFWILKGRTLTDFVLGICFYISISVIEKYSALFYGRQLYLLANNILLIGNLALLILLVLLSFVEIDNNNIFFEAYIGGTLFQAVILITSYHIIFKERLTFTFLTRDEFRMFFSYSLLAFFTNILQFLAYRIDYWLVDHYKGTAQLGLYSVSVRLAQLLWIIPNFFAAIIFPQVAGKQTEGDLQNILGLIRIMNTLNVIAGLLMFFFAPFFIVWIFGSEYANSLTPFQILLPGVVFFCVTTVLASYFAGTNKLIVNFMGTSICLLAILFFDFLLIPHHGIKGAAIASSIGYALSTVYSIFIFKQLTKVELSQLLIIKKEDLLYVREYLRKQKKPDN